MYTPNWHTITIREEEITKEDTECFVSIPIKFTVPSGTPQYQINQMISVLRDSIEISANEQIIKPAIDRVDEVNKLFDSLHKFHDHFSK